MAETKTTAAKTKTKFDNIAQALVAFQSDIPVPTKDSSADTGKYSYDYASLDKLTPLIFERLTAVGIAYTAAPDVREDGIFGLRAKLVHESGDEIGGFYPLGSPNNPAQAIGSAITYARRYALLSLTGVAPTGEDDDGARAHAAQASAPASAPSTAKPANSAAALRAEMGDLINGSGGLVTGDDANNIMAEITGGKSPAEWTATHLKAGKAKIQELIDSKKGA